MKIALVVHRFHPDFGGVEVTAELLAHGFVERHGAEVVVITHTKEHGTGRRFPFTVLRQPSPMALYRALQSADVIFHNNPCLQFYWPQLFLRKPWVVALRTWITMPGENLSIPARIKYWIKYRIVESADLLIANSSVLAGHVKPGADIIHNSYRSEIFRCIDNAERDRGSIVFLGRLSADKGIDLLLYAVHRLNRMGHSIHLTIIGDGDYRHTIQNTVSLLGISNQVTLVGAKMGAEISVELNRHAIAVVPSRIPEPFGTVALETAASGCVTVVANHGGLPEAIGDAGPKFQANSVDSLVEVLNRLILDDPYFYSFHKKIKNHVASHKEPLMVDMFYEALQRVVKNS